MLIYVKLVKFIASIKEVNKFIHIFTSLFLFIQFAHEHFFLVNNVVV